MRVRTIAVVAGLAAVLGVTVAVSAAAGKTQGADSITVWLQPEAKSGWQAAIDAATTAFQAKHPGVQVNVEEQQWTEHLAKLDASLAGGTVPDVVELGNSEMAKYMAAGAFADLTSAKSAFPNSSTWLKGLTDSATYNGRLFGVPYYAGARAVIYNKALYKGAGIKRTPEDARRVRRGRAEAHGEVREATRTSRRSTTPAATGTTGWRGSTTTAERSRGSRTASGSERSKSPQAVKGLTKLKSIVLSLSRATKTNDEAHPWQALVFSKGKVGSILGNGWEWGQAIDKKGGGNPKIAPLMAAYPMPSHVKGRYLPTFIGGSDLAIPASSPNRDLAIDWIAAFTSSANETLMAKAGTSRTRPRSRASTSRARSSTRSRSRRRMAGSSRARRTGRPSRSRSCSRTCSSRSSRTSRPSRTQRRRLTTRSRAS
jgi:N,N'-diacetylchitobiose transport system substrate-binding protein